MKKLAHQPVSLYHHDFDYFCIADKTARLAAIDAAANVRNGLSNQAELIIEIGTILIDAKDNLLPHGFFNDWLRLELAMSPRTAQQYMAVARNFGSKSASVAHLKPTTLYLLSSRKHESLRCEVFKRLEAGELLDDAGVLDIAKKNRVEHPREQSSYPTVDNTTIVENAVSISLAADTTPYKSTSALSELTAFLAPRCFGEFERLISLVNNAGLQELANFMQRHHYILMSDVTKLFDDKDRTDEEPGLFGSLTRATEDLHGVTT